MKKAVVLAAILTLTALDDGNAQDRSKLLNVKRIYVADLGKEEGSDIVKEKIKLLLMKSERFTVVESRENADALLVGAAGVNSRGAGAAVGAGVLRLVDPKSEETIWVYEYSRPLMAFGSEANRIAEKTVDKLKGDAKKAEKQKKGN